MARINANVEFGNLLVVGGLTIAGVLLWDHNNNDGKVFSEIQSLFTKLFSKDDDTKSEDKKYTKISYEPKVSAKTSTEKAQIEKGVLFRVDGTNQKTNDEKVSAIRRKRVLFH